MSLRHCAGLTDSEIEASTGPTKPGTSGSRVVRSWATMLTKVTLVWSEYNPHCPVPKSVEESYSMLTDRPARLGKIHPDTLIGSALSF